MDNFTPHGPLTTAAAIASAQPAKDRTVIVISLDGFPAYALADPYLPIPNLRQLIAKGSMARHA